MEIISSSIRGGKSFYRNYILHDSWNTVWIHEVDEYGNFLRLQTTDVFYSGFSRYFRLTRFSPVVTDRKPLRNKVFVCTFYFIVGVRDENFNNQSADICTVLTDFWGVRNCLTWKTSKKCGSPSQSATWWCHNGRGNIISVICSIFREKTVIMA